MASSFANHGRKVHLPEHDGHPTNGQLAFGRGHNHLILENFAFDGGRLAKGPGVGGGAESPALSAIMAHTHTHIHPPTHTHTHTQKKKGKRISSLRQTCYNLLQKKKEKSKKFNKNHRKTKNQIKKKKHETNQNIQTMNKIYNQQSMIRNYNYL